MNPIFLEELTPATSGPGVWRRLGRLLWRVGRLLLIDLLKRGNRFQVEVGTPLSRFFHGLVYRVMFIPLLLALLVTVLVSTGTHPRRPTVSVDPASLGIYFDPVDLLSTDQTRLEGWLVPVVEARRVLIEGESVLHQKYPAIVLAHDFGLSRQQVLPLVAPLHEAGYVVLAINLRGNAASSSGCTFGLNEAQDLRAAVEMLRRRTFVDPDAVGILGIGTGATAALLAAQQDPRLHVLVLDHPVRQFDDALAERIGPRQSWMSWCRPLCKWAFEIAYRVNASDIDLDRFAIQMQSAPVLLLDDPDESASSTKPLRQRQVVDFLRKHLVTRPRGTAILSPSQPALPARDQRDSDEVWPHQSTAHEILQQAGIKD